MATYPGAVATDSELYLVKANLSTTLAEDLDDSETSIDLTDASAFPDVGFIVVGSETIKYTGKSTNTLTGCTRGADSTTVASHTTGVSVFHAIVASHHNALKDEIIAVETELAAAKSGWTAVLDSWSYASATTITVPSGAASVYQVGDKIKLTQTTAKYFYVVAVADTVLTVTGGSDYTVANAAITSPYFSKVENPQGFPQWFNTAAPTWDTATVDNGAGGQPTTSSSRLKISGRTVQVIVTGSGTKARLGGFINLNPSSVYPALTNTNYKVALGSGTAGASNWYNGVVYASSATVWQLLVSTNWADNEVLANLTINVSYQI